MEAPSHSSLNPSPSDLTTGTAPQANGPADGVVADFEVLLRKLSEKEVETLRKLIVKLDEKELKAAGKCVEVERARRYRKKTVELRKKKCWSVCNRGTVDQNLPAEAKKQIDIELGDPRIPQCYEEIKRLLLIEKDPIYAKALEEWSRKELLFTSRVERKKTKVADLKNEIYQLIGFFSVFQGVLLTAVSQSNLLHCNNWWSPIILSVVASVVTIFGVVQKLSQIESFQTTIHSEEQSLKEVAARLSTLRNLGVEEFHFAEYEYKEKKKQSKFRFRIYFWLVIVSLVVFTAGFPISQWRILCKPGYNPYAATVPSP